MLRMLAAVRVEDHRTVLRLLAKHHTDLARWRNKICCRLYALVAELVAGGISKEVVVSDAFALLESISGIERPKAAVSIGFVVAVFAQGPLHAASHHDGRLANH